MKRDKVVRTPEIGGVDPRGQTACVAVSELGRRCRAGEFDLEKIVAREQRAEPNTDFVVEVLFFQPESLRARVGVLGVMSLVDKNFHKKALFRIVLRYCMRKRGQT